MGSYEYGKVNAERYPCRFANNAANSSRETGGFGRIQREITGYKKCWILKEIRDFVALHDTAMNSGLIDFPNS